MLRSKSAQQNRASASKGFVLGAAAAVLTALVILRASAANQQPPEVVEHLPPESATDIVLPEPEPPVAPQPAPEPVPSPDPLISPTPEPEPVELPKLYTDADAVALAQMAWGECRGVESLWIDGREISGKYQQAAAMWSALNRYDAGYEESIFAVIAAPDQFHGYAASNPVDDELLALAYDVLERWNMERSGCEDVGRVLPEDCHWFHGDGKYNYFRNAYIGGERYDWSLPDVYGGLE